MARAEASRSSDGAKKAAARRSADDWVMAAFRALASGTIDAVKVERLAADLGVTKGSFYWHFADRPALLRAMLDRWVELDTEQVIRLVDSRSSSDDPVEALRTLVRVVIGTTTEYDGVEAAIREWSAVDPAAAEVCSSIDDRRLAYVTDLLVAAGVEPETAAARAGLIYRIVIGEYTWRRYGGRQADLGEMLGLVDHLATP